MSQYSKLNVRLSNSQLDRLKSAIKYGTEATLKILSNVVGDSNDEANFPHKFLLAYTKGSRSRKAFANNSSAKLPQSNCIR